MGKHAADNSGAAESQYFYHRAANQPSGVLQRRGVFPHCNFGKLGFCQTNRFTILGQHAHRGLEIAASLEKCEGKDALNAVDHTRCNKTSWDNKIRFN